jgi:hypothetical protein
MAVLVANQTQALKPGGCLGYTLSAHADAGRKLLMGEIQADAGDTIKHLQQASTQLRLNRVVTIAGGRLPDLYDHGIVAVQQRGTQTQAAISRFQQLCGAGSEGPTGKQDLSAVGAGDCVPKQNQREHAFPSNPGHIATMPIEHDVAHRQHGVNRKVHEVRVTAALVMKLSGWQLNPAQQGQNQVLVGPLKCRQKPVLGQFANQALLASVCINRPVRNLTIKRHGVKPPYAVKVWSG